MSKIAFLYLIFRGGFSTLEIEVLGDGSSQVDKVRNTHTRDGAPATLGVGVEARAASLLVVSLHDGGEDVRLSAIGRVEKRVEEAQSLLASAEELVVEEGDETRDDGSGARSSADGLNNSADDDEDILRVGSNVRDGAVGAVEVRLMRQLTSSTHGGQVLGDSVLLVGRHGVVGGEATRGDGITSESAVATTIDTTDGGDVGRGGGPVGDELGAGSVTTDAIISRGEQDGRATNGELLQFNVQAIHVGGRDGVLVVTIGNRVDTRDGGHGVQVGGPLDEGLLSIDQTGSVEEPGRNTLTSTHDVLDIERGLTAGLRSDVVSDDLGDSLARSVEVGLEGRQILGRVVLLQELSDGLQVVRRLTDGASGDVQLAVDDSRSDPGRGLELSRVLQSLLSSLSLATSHSTREDGTSRGEVVDTSDDLNHITEMSRDAVATKRTNHAVVAEVSLMSRSEDVRIGNLELLHMNIEHRLHGSNGDRDSVGISIRNSSPLSNSMRTEPVQKRVDVGLGRTNKIAEFLQSHVVLIVGGGRVAHTPELALQSVSIANLKQKGNLHLIIGSRTTDTRSTKVQSSLLALPSAENTIKG